MSFLLRKVEDLTTISKSQSLTSRLHTENSKQNYYIIPLRSIIKAIFTPLHRGNRSTKNGPARIKRRMQWKASSKPLAVDDPLLLPEREVHSEIGIHWFLDQEIPKGGYVRILAESLLWEERLGKTKIRTTEGLTTCMEPRVDNCDQQLDFLRKRWLDR